MRIVWTLIFVLCCLLVAIIVVAALNSDGGAKRLPPIEARGTPLESGKYRTGTFRPQTTFEVGDGWETTSPELRDYFDIARRSAFRAISFERVGTVAPAQDPTGHSRGIAPPDLVQWIQAHPRLSAGRPVKTRVNGLPATRLDAKVESAEVKLPSCLGPCLPLFYPSDGTPVSYEPGDMLRFLFVRAGRRKVTITIAAPAARFRSFLPQAQEVISTVEFAAR